jgi:hypothetical protein
MSHYVRARHYSYVTGGWSTVDPLWLDERPFAYVNGRATRLKDPSGLVAVRECSAATNGLISRFCGIFKDKDLTSKFNKCVMDCVSTIPFKINPNCFVKFCDKGKVTCGDCKPANQSGQSGKRFVECPPGCGCTQVDADTLPPCGITPCPTNGNIYLCNNASAKYMKGCGCKPDTPPWSVCPDGTGGGGQTFLHELGHYCGPDCNRHRNQDDLAKHQKFVECLNRCMNEVLK